MIKAPFFAFIIALIGCYEGFQVARSAESVGRLTTLSVVEVDLSRHRRRRGLFDRLFDAADLSVRGSVRANRSSGCAASSTGLAPRRCMTVSISMSGAARCSASSAARAPANRCCCARSSGSTGRPRARSRCSGAMFWAMSDAQRRELEKRWGVLFQDGALFSSLTVAQNIEVPLREYYRHAAAPDGRDRGVQDRHGRAARGRRRQISRRSCRAACASAPGSPAPWRSIRKSCFSTSRPPGSTRSPPALSTS